MSMNMYTMAGQTRIDGAKEANRWGVCVGSRFTDTNAGSGGAPCSQLTVGCG